MFSREALTGLKAWAAEKDRKPLVLRGVRQSGKTSLVKIFSADFDHYIYFNLEKGDQGSSLKRSGLFQLLLMQYFF